MGLILGSSVSTQALEFDGTGNVAYDRVNIELSGAAANVGSADFTYQTWIKPTSANNNTGSTAVDGSIFIDRDNLIGGTSGEFVLSILGNTIALAVAGTDFSYTETTASSTVNDNAWHFITFSFDRSTGDFNLYVDADREVDSSISADDIQWVSGGNANDARLVWGVEKHAQGEDLSFFGRQSETRIQDTYVNTSTVTVPTSPMGTDGNTICYWPFDEGSGTTVRDTVDGGNSNGTIVLNGGSPPPTWVVDSPY